MDSAAGGDVFITLKTAEGKDRVLQLRPSIGFIKKLDQRGVKLMALLKKFREHEYGLTEMALVIWASAVEAVSIDDAEELLFNTGVATVEAVMPVVQVITNALNGGRPAPAKAEEEAADPQK